MDARRPKDQKISNRSGFGVDAEITYIMDTSKIILFMAFLRTSFLPLVTFARENRLNFVNLTWKEAMEVV